MTKPIRSYGSDEAKKEVINRRLTSGTGGLGYLSAIDAAKKLGIEIPEKKAKRQNSGERTPKVAFKKVVKVLELVQDPE